MNIDSYIQATRFNVSDFCDNDRYDEIWRFLSAEMPKMGLRNLPSPKLVWTPSRLCEIVTIDGYSSIIYDQTLGEDLAKLNQIVLDNTGKDEAFRRCAHLLFRRLAEYCLIEQDFVGAAYFYKHELYFGHTDGHTSGAENNANKLNCHTLFQEFYILAHEYGHYEVDSHEGKYVVDLEGFGINEDLGPNKNDDVIVEMIRKLYDEDPKRFVELFCDKNAYFLGTLWMRAHPDFEEYSRYAVLPTIILFRHMMIMCIINALLLATLRVWRRLCSMPIGTGAFQVEFEHELKEATNDPRLQGDLALVICRRRHILIFLRKIASIFPSEDQNVLFDGFLPLMDKYYQRVDQMFNKVLFQFLPQDMASTGAAMKRYNNDEGLVALRSMCECDQRMSTMLSMVDSLRMP